LDEEEVKRIAGELACGRMRNKLPALASGTNRAHSAEARIFG
jgi:hypothetical protein